MSLFAFVKIDDFFRVNGQVSVWIDYDAEQPGIRVDQPGIISDERKDNGSVK